MSAMLFASDYDAPHRLAASAAQADRRATARLTTAIADFFMPERGRLDERGRAAIGALIESTVLAIEGEIAGYATRLLMSREVPEAALALSSNQGITLLRLLESGLLRDAGLMGELVAQSRLDMIDAALIANRVPGAHPTMLPLLAESDDSVVRGRAVSYLVAESRRRMPGVTRRAELPGELHRRLGWWIAAALRERLPAAAEVDRALVESTQRSITAYDEGERADVAALQLAAALDPTASELPRLLIEALAEGRSILFVALLAHTLDVEPVEARGLTLDAESDRLWLALRALGIDRESIAHIGFLLSEADRERDVETLADVLDPIASLAPELAAQAVAPLSLHREFRAAVRALARRPRD